ncbi:hypothetical protein P7K49_031990 [Saguinus oedipus]|uniref:Uncharacterized protein n=1 Tax=Saguinus oedipus TaxID=9490 RepID=A0ABQ9TX14_SAGOE|nr:hypothetical protein P7K49_031990 [Saguinus oedipus]
MPFIFQKKPKEDIVISVRCTHRHPFCFFRRDGPGFPVGLLHLSLDHIDTKGLCCVEHQDDTPALLLFNETNLVTLKEQQKNIGSLRK